MCTDRNAVARYFCAIVILGAASSDLPAQHVHGVIDLGVVVEDATVAVSLNAPLSDVAGFEHAPESDEQSAIVERAAALLSNADDMFGLTAAANCTVKNATLDGPAYISWASRSEAAESAQHSDGHDHDHDSHGDEAVHHDHLDGEEHEPAEDHDHHGEEGHAGILANYEWECADVSALDAIELRFIDGFANVETIKIQLLTSAGAQVITAGRRDTSISLESP